MPFITEEFFIMETWKMRMFSLLLFYVRLIIVYKNCAWGILISFEYFCKVKWISTIISINYTPLLTIINEFEIIKAFMELHNLI